jgi:hypothetical protein
LGYILGAKDSQASIISREKYAEGTQERDNESRKTRIGAKINF